MLHWAPGRRRQSQRALGASAPHQSHPRLLRWEPTWNAHAQTQTNISCAPRCLVWGARPVLTRTQLALTPGGHSTRDTNVHRGGATLRPHWTSCPLTAPASQAPAPLSQICSSPAALGFGPAPSRPPAQTCRASGPWKSVPAPCTQGSAFTPAYPPGSGARVASRLPGLHAPRAPTWGTTAPSRYPPTPQPHCPDRPAATRT